jgi:3-methyladenine DNA glycosylase AlkD
MTNKWKTSLTEAARPEKIKILSSFFKTGKGEYGEGDIFIGLPVPDNRKISKDYWDAPLSVISDMLNEPTHEFRFAALIALVRRYGKTKDRDARKEIAKFYIDNSTHINNWDLVDLSCPQIIGEYTFTTGDRKLLTSLSHSPNMWQRRIAMVSTLYHIRHNSFEPTIEIATTLLHDKESLIHKATGWMLREMGKRSITILRNYLDTYATSMPRTALRYAIEKMDKQEQFHYLKLK